MILFFTLLKKAIKLSKESEQKSHKTTAVLDETGDENGTNSYEFSPQQVLFLQRSTIFILVFKTERPKQTG